MRRLWHRRYASASPYESYEPTSPNLAVGLEQDGSELTDNPISNYEAILSLPPTILLLSIPLLEWEGRVHCHSSGLPSSRTLFKWISSTGGLTRNRGHGTMEQSVSVKFAAVNPFEAGCAPTASSLVMVAMPPSMILKK